ncbi:MAG: MBL fold metallo-hydrolase [Thermoguttaceae bacterium]
MRSWKPIVLLSVSGMALTIGLSRLAAADTTRVAISLVRADQPRETVDAARQGSDEPHYRGPVTTWPFGLTVDGKHEFDERDAKGQVVRRLTSLALDLAEGEHAIDPGAHKFRIAQGKVESLSPEILVHENRVALRLHPVTFTTAEDQGAPAPVWLRLAWKGRELWRNRINIYTTPLTLYLPATPEGGYESNVSPKQLRVSAKGAELVDVKGQPPGGFDVSVEGFTVRVPTWKVTGVLLADQVPKNPNFYGLGGLEGATNGNGFSWNLGSWEQRARTTTHAVLSMSLAGWNLQTDLHSLPVPWDMAQRYRHHVVIVDRPVFGQSEGTRKERIVHLALSSDITRPGGEIHVQWSCRETKGLEALKEPKLAAFLQRAPTCADETAGWTPLPTDAEGPGRASLTMPASLRPGNAWLRIGLAEAVARPTDRLLAEIRLVVKEQSTAPAPPAAAVRTVRIGTPLGHSNVPDPWRQGEFLHPQSVSAVDVSDDGRLVGVTTMAFRHDRNFRLLSREGKVLWGRYVEPWAPFQAAVLPGGKAFGVGMAYSRWTDPGPTVSLFTGETVAETPLVDAFWDLGWLRYGQGDWRTGWPASLVGDLLVRARGSAVTICGQEGARRLTSDGRIVPYPLPYQRPFRMASSADGHALAFGYLVPDASRMDKKTAERMRLPPALLAVSNGLSTERLWTAGPMQDAKPVAQPPEPAGEFPEMAEEFNMKPLSLVPLRVAVSAAISGDGSRTAIHEYGGWLRVKRERGVGTWNPDYPVPFCPRPQRGWLRVFGPLGEEFSRAELPAEGLFEVRMNRQGDRLWCVPMGWFARGLAGRPWLPADREAHTVFVYDLRRRAWTDAWRFPDAVSDLAVHPDGDRVLVSCWDGTTYLVGREGTVEQQLRVGRPARVCWSADGQFAAVGTDAGEVLGVDAQGKQLWRIALPATEVPPAKEAFPPVFADAPIYDVGHVGKEYAYANTWLVKTRQGGFLIDTGGVSGIPYSLQRMKAAGLDPKDVRHVLLTHSHGDHCGGAYLWRTQGLKIVAARTAELTMTWLMPIWTDYSIWPPTPIDQPLPLRRAGDETQLTVCGVPIKVIFVPGHAFDQVLYLMELDGKRIMFTGDVGFGGESHILHRCWGDREKAAILSRVMRAQALPFKPDYVFTGHDAQKHGTAFLEDLLKRTDAALAKPPGK